MGKYNQIRYDFVTISWFKRFKLKTNLLPKRQVRTQPRTRTTSSIDLGSISTTEGFKIQGNLQPFRLHDTYAVDLTLSPESDLISVGAAFAAGFVTWCLTRPK
ncbi:MAG TPA: hypothetical protein DDW76_31800 [Cyanobacteria bacterium UBA11369]|nr:hypothetical protein [Cyanobacteria bacterium UBA11371]HBE33946.1 hypothetical protein [Cyanobacteria bacterium UBA11368]HBE53227.1 hypothetical protein [Cyanobacteria bacterium UBA11369]